MPDLTPGGVGTVIDEALAPLERLEDLAVHEHVEVFDNVHRTLQDTLATLDEA